MNQEHNIEPAKELADTSGRQRPAREPSYAGTDTPTHTLPAGLQFLLIFVLLAAGIVVAGSFYYHESAQNFRTQAERQLSAIADLKVGELTQWREDRLGDAAIFLKNPSFTAMVRQFFAQPADTNMQRQLQDWLGKYPALEDYDQVSLMDTQAITRFSLPGGLNPASADTTRAVDEAVLSGQIAIQDFYRQKHNQRVYLSVQVPLLDESNANRLLGVLVLRIDPAKYLYPFICHWPTHSATAETLLLRRDGNDALFLNELRFQTNTVLNLREPLNGVDCPEAQATLGREGIIHGTDYRGVPVMAAMRTVPSSPWAMVARMDITEIYAPLRPQLWQVIVLTSVLIFGAGAGVVLIWWQQRVRFLKKQVGAAVALQASEDKYRSLVETTGTGFLILNCKGRVMDANPEYVRLAGYDELLEILGRQVTEWTAAHDIQRTGEAVAQCIIDRRIRNLVIDYSGKNGLVTPVEINATVLGEGESLRIVSLCRDITERKKAEKREKELLLRAEQTTRMESMGVLVGGVAHDLNNILGPILLLPDLIADYIEQHGNSADPGHADALEAVETIRDSANRAAGVVSDLVVMGRRGQFQKAPVDVNRVVELALAAKQIKAMQEARTGVQVLKRLANESLWCLGSESRLVRILMNLINNGAEAISGVGDIVVRTSRELFSEPRKGYQVVPSGDYVIIEVKDTGCGMDEKTIARMFEPFFSTKKSSERSGSGLGLSVVHGLVKDHAGFLDVTSLPGKGTTFTVFLPAVGADKAQEASPKKRLPGGNERILVADDELGQQVLSRQQLKKLGYDIVVVSSGEEALVLFEATSREGKPSPFDLVVMDVIMKEMDGLATCRAILEMYPKQKLVIASGHAPEGYEEQLKGMDAKWLAKPYTDIDLAYAVRSQLDI